MKRKLLLMPMLVVLLIAPAFGALTITSSNVTDWTAVAEGAHSATGSSVIDISGNYKTYVQIQAFLDQDAQAHEGTEFKIQISQKTSGDEDWSDFWVTTALDGTPNIEPLPGTLNSGSVTDIVADTGGLYETANTVNPHMGRWLAIEDTVALAASELLWQTAFVADTSITWLDGTTNTHLDSADFWDVAMSRTILIEAGVGSRARVIVNNSYDADGTASSLNYKVNKTVVTAL